jgi:hypothetical protein
MRLPVYQVRAGQRRPAQVAMQPHAKVMKSHLRDQARLKPAEVMGPFPIEAEGMRELLIDSLYDLAVFGRNNPSSYTVNGRPLYVHLNGLAIVLLK